MKENTEVHKQETTHSLIKIKILLAYLEKILYLWAVGVRGNRKNSLFERDEHRTPTLRNTAENRTHCWMTSNPMNDALTRIKFLEMNEGGMSEYYSDAIDNIIILFLLHRIE